MKNFIALLLLSACISCQLLKPRHNPSAQVVPENTAIKYNYSVGAAYKEQSSFRETTFYADGRVVSEMIKGEDRTNIKTTESRISREELQEMIAAIYDADFFSLRDTYYGKDDGCPPTSIGFHNPHVTISVRLGDREKKVAHSHNSCKGYPRALVELENALGEKVPQARE